MNFFKLGFSLNKWNNMSEQATPIHFEINFSLSHLNFKLSTKAKLDFFTLNQLLKFDRLEELFRLLTLHFETLQALFRLDQSFRYCDTVGQHSVTGRSYFLFHQITPLCWELQFLPYARFFQEFSFFHDNFVSIRFRLDADSSSIFLFQELKTGELILNFYDIFRQRFEDHIHYAELILRVSNLDSKGFLRLCECLISFTMVRTNLKLCKSYVGLTSSRIERKCSASASTTSR